MPSLTSLLKGPRGEKSQIDDQVSNGIGSSHAENDSTEKVQQRQSKRDFFRSLLKRSSINSKSKRRSLDVMTSSISQPPKTPDTPTSPMSNPNKPLPPPPPGVAEPEPASRPTLNPQRIISPIALPELRKLFSGAPQFFARSEGHHTGAPHPSVAFPWDLEVDIRDLCDHTQIHDEAWSSVTAWPHITRDIERSAEAVKEHHEKQKAHFLPRCRERPNMLSMQGIERGTIGYAAALELGVADALNEPEETLPQAGPDSIAERRKKFLNGKNGLRPLTESTLLERLINASVTYHEDPLKHHKPTVELYQQLFTQILFPPSRVIDSDDPYSLQVQIEALIQTLAAPHIWFDFSLVEWRIRLGQILWGPPIGMDSDDDVTVDNAIFPDPGSQKFWLLLQILLSCELLLRLDAVAMNIDHGLVDAKPSDLKRFDKTATTSVRWSLILARQWFENIQVDNSNPESISMKKPSAGWLATITGNIASGTAPVGASVNGVRIHGRHQSRQLSGLLHFAQKLRWPNAEALAAKISSNCIAITDSSQSTPVVGTPLSVSTQRSTSYFSNRRPGYRRGMSKQHNLSAAFHPHGWLSNSYVSGLILPGEGLSHFLISTLLENDDNAVLKLGQEANLYGGFAYGNRSFWSTACIVGRILAAGKGSSECLGWVSSDIVPHGIGEAWFDIEVETVPESDNAQKKPRIWLKTAIEHDGNVIGGADASSVLPGDFILPSDESAQRPFSVKLESLDFFAAVDSVNDTPLQENPTPLTDNSEPPSIRTYSAMMRFSVDSDGEEKKELNFSLQYDVHFVTSHPCVASQHTDLLMSPTSPSFQKTEPRSPGIFTGHPLHKGFTYTKVPLSTILSLPSTLPFDSLLSPPQSPLEANLSTMHTTNSTIPKVLVIDCTDSTMTAFPIRPSPSPQTPHPHKHRFGSDMEILARALCAERGWNALISRKGRGCLACTVREAGALGWRVILRFA